MRYSSRATKHSPVRTTLGVDRPICCVFFIIDTEHFRVLSHKLRVHTLEPLMMVGFRGVKLTSTEWISGGGVVTLRLGSRQRINDRFSACKTTKSDKKPQVCFQTRYSADLGLVLMLSLMLLKTDSVFQKYLASQSSRFTSKSHPKIYTRSRRPRVKRSQICLREKWTTSNYHQNIALISSWKSSYLLKYHMLIAT